MPILFPTSEITRLETAAQDDMQERARRLREFKAKTEGKVWQYFEESGQWLLVPVMDGSVQHAA